MSREGDWICNSCQHLNFKKRESCHKCHCPKFGGMNDAAFPINRTEVLAGDWYCNVINCGAHNYASRTSCYKCCTSKIDYSAYGGSGLPGWKNGDWICSRLGCGGHNYAVRTECFRCGTPKDFSG